MSTRRPFTLRAQPAGKESRHVVGALLLLAICASAPSSLAKPAKKSDLTWPPPPEAARIRYVQSITGPGDLRIRRSLWGRAADFITGQSRRVLLGRPFGLFADHRGNLLLADTAANAVFWFDVTHHRFRSWDKIGHYRLASPVAVAQQGETFYVADSALATVLAFNLKGQLQAAMTNGLQRPAGLAILNDKLFVADARAHRISVFDLQGRFLKHFGNRGMQPGQFNFPTHLAVAGNDRLLVTDSMNCRVQILDPDGQPLSVVGSPGDGSGHFSRPKGIAADSSGHVYVADALFDNIQIFDASGAFLLHFGEAGQSPGEFWMPGGIAIGGNRIYVADTYNRRVQVFEYIGQP